MAKISVSDALVELNAKIVASVTAIPKTVKIPDLQECGADGDEEQAVLVLSDIQIGHHTPTTTIKIIGNRMNRLVQRLIKIVGLHRNAYPINKLHVFLLGDLIQGEEIGFKVSLNELEAVVYDQILVAVELLANALITLLGNFPGGIDVWTASGNHGRIDRFHAETTNWDTLIYKMIEARLKEHPEVRWHIADKEFYQKVKIGKHTFLITHGDMIKMWMNIPWYGVTQRAMRWKGALPGNDFQYLALGHFHVAGNYQWNDVHIFTNGCFVSDDQWVLKQIGMASTTSQWFFGVHPRQGVSWRYLIQLD